MEKSTNNIWGGICFWCVFVAAWYFIPHMIGCSNFVDWVMPAKIKGLYGVELGKPYSGWEGGPAPADCPYGSLHVSKLKKTRRVYEIEATVRKSLQELLSLVKDKYGIKPTIKQFSDSKESYYYFEDFRSNRAILVWKTSDDWVLIRATDYDLKKLDDKEKRELELDAL